MRTTQAFELNHLVLGKLSTSTLKGTVYIRPFIRGVVVTISKWNGVPELRLLDGTLLESKVAGKIAFAMYEELPDGEFTFLWHKNTHLKNSGHVKVAKKALEYGSTIGDYKFTPLNCTSGEGRGKDYLSFFPKHFKKDKRWIQLLSLTKPTEYNKYGYIVSKILSDGYDSVVVMVNHINYNVTHREIDHSFTIEEYEDSDGYCEIGALFLRSHRTPKLIRVSRGISKQDKRHLYINFSSYKGRKVIISRRTYSRST